MKFSRLTFRGLVATFIILLSACSSGGGGEEASGGAAAYTVTATAGEGGTITPASATVAGGGTTAFTVTANAGYHVAEVTGCDGSLSGNTYTTGAVTADCTVTASFATTPVVQYTIGVSVSPLEGGNVTGGGIVSVGTSVTLTATPNAGYTFVNWTEDATPVSTDTSYSFTATAHRALVANFALNSYTVSTSAGANGSISPGSANVNHGATASFTVTPNDGYSASVTGCGGTLAGNTFTTGAITGDCTVTASFLPGVSVDDTSGSELVTDDSGVTHLLFTVTLTGPADGNVTVEYATADGTAFAGHDYTATGGTLTITGGSTSGTISVPVRGDSIPEGNETFTLTLSSISANALLGTATATGTINDDDPFGRLNDTGITACANASSNALSCPQADFPGQDAEYGRDVTANDDSDGHAGFSFTKLDASGKPLTDQSVSYGTTPWACVQDNRTGLIWEVKTDDGGLHDKDWTYSWYNSDSASNGGVAGTESGGSCGGTVAAGCDTEKFVAAVNAAGWCGANDWRLPTRMELASLIDRSVLSIHAPTIDARFPNTAAEKYWTSATPAGAGAEARYADFLWGMNYFDSKSNAHYVRLVRGGE